jgi:hypothetical protein
MLDRVADLAQPLGHKSGHVLVVFDHQDAHSTRFLSSRDNVRRRR